MSTCSSTTSKINPSLKKVKHLLHTAPKLDATRVLWGNNDGSKEETSYKGMLIQYSGYYGVDKQPGKEYITIVGELTTDLMMKAFAFEVGNAKIEYEWGKSQTGCCMGTAPCGEHIHVSRSKERRGGIGEIPRGKKNLKIDLEADADVDIQLYDTEDTTKFPEGKQS